MDPAADAPPARPLTGAVALVTGASRGVGKGCALALGAAGATVYVTGRTRRGASGRLGGTIDDTADEVTRRGGRGVALACDHADDAQVAAVFEQIARDAGRLEILVNNVFAVPEGHGPLYGTPFWEQPLAIWDVMTTVGVRSHYVAAWHAARTMAAAGAGLIANISSFGAASYQVNVAYGVGKAAVDRLTRDAARELRPRGVCVVSLWPGVVRTERVLAGDLPYDTSISESPELTGRGVVALATDPDRLRRSGKPWVVAELAAEYGFDDVDGSRPRSLRRPQEAR